MRLLGHRVVADLAAALAEVAHHRGKEHPALRVGQAFGHAVAHRGDQRMRGAQVDADGGAAFVGIRRGAGFGDLQQGHGKPLLSQLFGAGLEVFAKALDEHEGSHLLRRRGRVMRLVEQLPDAGQVFAAAGRQPVGQRVHGLW